MVKSVEGVYRNGKIELLEPAPQGVGERVIVTFLPSVGEMQLGSRGINPEQAADLRARLGAFADDWQRPEMDAYDAL